MSPELHVQKFLESTQDRYTPNIYKEVKMGLKYYLSYLSYLGEKIEVSSPIIQNFREHLYRERCHDIPTISNYFRGVKDFYEYLSQRGIIQKNPAQDMAKRWWDKLYYLRKSPLKERSYTDDEIIRSYLVNWRKIYSKASGVMTILQAYKKIQIILSKLKIRLQVMDRKNLEDFCQELDSLLSRYGIILTCETRQRTLKVLRKILRWMHRNGYRDDDPGHGFTYPFKASSIESLIPQAPTHSLWQELGRKFFLDAQVRWRPRTIEMNRQYSKGFFRYLTETGIQDVQQISLSILENYRARIYANEKYADTTKWSKLAIARYFMNWLERTEQILINPTRRMTWPKGVQGLPTRLMSPHDISVMMSAPDMRSPFGLRDRAIFELMYSTGLRVGEVGGLRLEDIDFENGLLRVQTPKGGPSYQRVVPIGGIALSWVRRYISEARDSFSAKTGSERMLFLTKNGGVIKPSIVNGAMRHYAMKQGMRKLYSSHSWRVSCATAMLRNRADIRYVQEQLGHRSLNSTKIYTRLFPMDLKKVHQKTHPREREARRLASEQQS